jgi:hypothetical protein
MPRVNRDLQRRMAARRERDRRRPTEPRYTFTTSEPGLESEEELAEQDGQTPEAVEAEAGSADTATAAAQAPTSVRGVPRPSSYKPFSAYKQDYAYVSSDLRRVAAVIGGLLAGLIVLYFLLPILVR